MPRHDPAHRFRALVASDWAEPTHAFEQALRALVLGQVADPSVERAYEIQCDPTVAGRDGLRAWLISRAKDDEISGRLGLSIDTIQAFRHLFFDVHVFRDHLDLVAWLRTESTQRTSTPDGLRCMQWAITHGCEAVAYLMCLPSSIDAREVQRQGMMDSHYQSLMGRDAAIDSSSAKEALKHRQVAVSLAERLAKNAPPSARDFAVKLKHRQLTTSIEVVDQTTEVLH